MVPRGGSPTAPPSPPPWRALSTGVQWKIKTYMDPSKAVDAAQRRRMVGERHTMGTAATIPPAA